MISSPLQEPVSRSHPYDPASLEEIIGESCAAVTLRGWMPAGDPDAIAHSRATIRSEGQPFIRLLRFLGWPDLLVFLQQVLDVALAARECPDPAFSNDIRGDNWPTKSDTSGDVAVLAQPDKWHKRLLIARRWQESLAEQAAIEGSENVVSLHGAASSAARRWTAAELLADANEAPDDCYDVMGFLTAAAVAVCSDPENLNPARLSDEALAALSQHGGL